MNKRKAFVALVVFVVVLYVRMRVPKPLPVDMTIGGQYDDRA